MNGKRKFNLAAWEYIGLSSNEDIAPEDQLEVLKEAMTCAILCPAGDAKHRVLAALHKDERTTSIEP